VNKLLIELIKLGFFPKKSNIFNIIYMEQEMSPKYEAQLRSKIRFMPKKNVDKTDYSDPHMAWQAEHDGIGTNNDYILFDDKGNIVLNSGATHPDSLEAPIIEDEIRKQYEARFPGKTLDKNLANSIDKK